MRAITKFALLGLTFAAPSLAQRSGQYIEEFGDYTVHYSVVPAELIPERVQDQHDLPENGIGLLNVAVRENGRNVPARISAAAVNLVGQRREIPMREVIENDLVSYLGTVDAGASNVLDFELQVQPAGAEDAFQIEFRERLTPPPGTLPPR